ncbi:MAG: hypothetical protein LBM65_02585, partial [Oscillospiraceae bacterium]|nr:hypothetical protein [Oscillospiraceae bacterium]
MANPNNLSNLIEEFDFYKNEESIERFVGGTGTKVYVAKVEVDGTPAKINTTWVKIYFSEPVLGLTTDNFLVAGANKDSVTDLNNDGLIYQVNISGYKVGNAREIHIAFATIPDEYDIEPDGVDVIIWRKEFDIVDVQPNGENRTVTTDAVDITIKPGLKGLVASNFTIENAEITKVEEILPPEEQPLLILKAQLDEIEQQIVEKRVEISNLNNQIRSANETTAPSLEAQHAVLEAELEALENQKKNIQEQIYSLMTIEDVVKEIDLLEQELATINETIANVKQQIDTASTSAPAESASPVETSDLATVFTTINNELMHQLTELQIARDNLVQQIDELRQVLRIKQEEAEEDRRREDKNRSNIADLQRRIAELQESIVRRQAEAEAIMAQISASTGSANISLTRQHAELLEQIAYEQSQLVEVEMQLQRLLYGNQGHQQVGEPELIADNDDAETVYRVHFTIADTVINGDVLRSAIIGTGESISPEEFGIQVFVHEKLRKWVQITNSEPQKIAITPGTYATIALDKPFVDDSKLMHIDQSQIIFDKAGDYEVTFSAEFDVSTTGYIEFKFAGAAEHTFRVPTAPGGASNLVTETFMLYDIKPEDLIYV